VETSRFPSSTDEFAPAWPCSRRGLPGRAHYCTRRWSLTPPFHHHYPARKGGVAVCFCGPVPAGSRLSAAFPPRVLSDAVLYGVRTFLDPVNAEPRLPDQPEALSSYPPGATESTWGQDSVRRGWEGPPWEEENTLRKHQGIGIKVCCENQQKDIKIGGNPPSLRSRCEPSAREIHHRFDR